MTVRTQDLLFGRLTPGFDLRANRTAARATRSMTEPPRSQGAPDTQATRDHGHESYDYWRYEGRDWRWFDGIYARMRPVPPVLDLGSGLGFFLECCVRHGMKVVGVELSKEGTRAAAERGLPVVRADLAVPLPFRDNSFGSALAHHVLEHVPLDLERAILRETRRVLRPGGFLFVVSPNTYHPQARDDPDHINLFTPHALRRELRGAGFRTVSLGTNYWRPFWEPALRIGKVGTVLAGALWKVAPVDRLAGTASAIAWK